MRRLTLVSEFNARDHNHVGTKIKRQQNEVSVETPKNGIANRRVGRPPRKKSQESDGRIHTVEQANQAEQKGASNDMSQNVARMLYSIMVNVPRMLYSIMVNMTLTCNIYDRRKQ